MQHKHHIQHRKQHLQYNQHLLQSKTLTTTFTTNNTYNTTTTINNTYNTTPSTISQVGMVGLCLKLLIKKIIKYNEKYRHLSPALSLLLSSSVISSETFFYHYFFMFNYYCVYLRVSIFSFWVASRGPLYRCFHLFDYFSPSKCPYSSKIQLGQSLGTPNLYYLNYEASKPFNTGAVINSCRY